MSVFPCWYVSCAVMRTVPSVTAHRRIDITYTRNIAFQWYRRQNKGFSHTPLWTHFCGAPCRNVVFFCTKLLWRSLSKCFALCELLWCSLSKCCFPFCETAVVVLVKSCFPLYELLWCSLSKCCFILYETAVVLVEVLFPKSIHNYFVYFTFLQPE